jgi:ketosteroid isomerase-like protein
MGTPAADIYELIHRWARAVNERDVDTLLGLAHPDIEHQPLRLTGDGVYNGHDGVARWMDGRGLEAPGLQVRIEHVEMLSGERAAAFGRVEVDGRDVSPYALVAIVRDGKVAKLRSYLSDKPTMERLGLL